MFKALFVTQNQIQHPHSTFNRRFISRLKGKVQYSPQDSPNKREEQKRDQQESVNQKTSQQIQKLNLPFKFTQIEGKLRLYHQYQLQKSWDSFNQTFIDRKRQEVAALTQFKTNILGLIDIFQSDSKIKILSKLLEVKDEIQTVDICSQKYQFGQNSKDLHKSDIFIYFKNSIMSEEFYKIFYRQFKILPIYFKQVVILQRNMEDELSYHDVLTCFEYTQNSSQIVKRQIDLFQKQWIQLPKCPNCLLKLQFQVSGIDEKVLNIVGQNKAQFNQCSTCKIIEQHRKQIQNHRKLSYEEGYKDHYKSEKHAHCDDCKQKSDIWICMVCGRVGCGRYKNADAYKHFVKSGHTLSIDLQTQRVWNYLSDCFSHKLLKHAIEPASNVKFPQVGIEQGQKMQQATLEAAFWQYCSVFSQQMERQRIFYENIKKSAEQKFQMQSQTLDTLFEELSKLSQQKSLQLKKNLKQKKKILKKQKQMQLKVSDERQVLKDYQTCLSVDLTKDFLQKDQDIVAKMKQLQILDEQINQVLIQLSN